MEVVPRKPLPYKHHQTRRFASDKRAAAAKVINSYLTSSHLNHDVLPVRYSCLRRGYAERPQGLHHVGGAGSILHGIIKSRSSCFCVTLTFRVKYQTLDLSKLEQKEEWYLQINSNGRIPAIVDKDANGEPLRVFESGAILQYLVATYDTNHRISYPYGSTEHWETTSWVIKHLPRYHGGIHR